MCDVGAEDVGAEVTTETQSPSKAHLASFLAAATGLARGEDAKGAVVTDGTGTSATQKKSEMSRKKALEEPQRTPKTSLSLAFAAPPPRKAVRGETTRDRFVVRRRQAGWKRFK